MAKVLALDIGGRRTGMAETDPLGMMAFPLKTVDTGSLMEVLEEYVAAEGIQTMVIGKPAIATDSTEIIDLWAAKIHKRWPPMEIVFVDEDFTSKEASQMLIMGGMKKSKRKEKGTLDKVAASLILERYLAMH
ncbi:MAG: Holliday junction resolvase RuvX [Schleiferiaceae bacterium]|jgi:putative Holliday junction resolvase|nr:Holliday junction resolvase RuvX [Schleiferiaceae bacterium]